ncbi:MAG TPA: fumarylacetoacetate hydrolase family protein [Polyangiaceae bacterium]|nr:fumarylacetoacetate hydrolase family protein [Polyangiaceae bacterium]
MRLATLDDGTRDGRLVIVSSDGSSCCFAEPIARTLQQALDAWSRARPELLALSRELERGSVRAEPLAVERLLAPLPRAYEWIDGSAYLNHIRLARRARGAEPPPGLETDPLVYQGGSGVLLGPRTPIALPDAGWGLDFEAEVALILNDVRRGLSASGAEPAIALVMLANDLSYRNLIPAELAKGFGFFNSKPATAFSAFAVTPDELGAAWSGGRLHLPVHCWVNGTKVGQPDAGRGMFFSFHELIAHIAKTRAFTAGTILGGGTVSEEDRAAGVGCLAEQRCLESLATGAASTRFLDAGDTIRIAVYDERGRDVFGSIEQEVIRA